MKLLLLCVSLMFCFACAHGQQAADVAQRLDHYLQAANDAYRFNGVALIMLNDEVVLNKGYGFSNMTTRTPNTPDTRFPILSITKSFTATEILKLQDEGKLSVDNKLSKYLPDYPDAAKISIHHLLTHTSGIYNYTDDIGIEDSAIVNYPLPKSFVLNYFRDRPAQFAPGKYFSYNNSGYFLLGLIIARVTGKTYEQKIREDIFEPLGMSQSGFDFNHLPPSVKAKGYELWNERQTVPYKHYDSTFGYSAGAIYSTSNDMMKWARAVSHREILQKKTWEAAFKPKIQNYGYGWQTGKFFNHGYVKHSGGYPGFMSEFIYYPENNIVIVLLNNFGTYDQNIWSVGMGLSSIMLGLPYDEWKLRKEGQADSLAMQSHTGIYENGKSKIEVKYWQGKLFAVLNGTLELELHPYNDNSYFFQNFNTDFFFRNGGLTVHEHGADYDWIRKGRKK